LRIILKAGSAILGRHDDEKIPAEPMMRDGRSEWPVAHRKRI